MRVKIICILVALTMLMSFDPLFADDKLPPSKDQLQEKLEDEFKWIAAESIHLTEIATKTQMDSDMVPGTATILDGLELERKGIRTVGEALSLIPSFDFYTGNNGTTTPSLRGIGLGSTRKIKAMLNGVPQNASLEGEVVPIYFIPIEQVEKIEVIRGPGSALYGKWAFLGVINVITRQKGHRIFGRYGSFDAHHGGLMTSYASSDDTFKASINIGAWDIDSTDVTAGPDAFTPSGMSNAPGPINDSRFSPTGVVTAAYKWVSLIGQSTETQFGSHFGMTEALPPYKEDLVARERIQTLEMRMTPSISDTFNVKLNAGIRRYLWNSGELWLYPAGYITPYDSIGNSYYEEQAYYGGIETHFTGMEKQNILLGAEYETVDMKDVWLATNFDPVTYQPVPYQTFYGDENWIKEDQHRDILGLYFQDQIDMTQSVTITCGLRYDLYKDTQNNFDQVSPRIAAVYRLSPHHIFKAQYAKAFRPPSFVEMYAQNIINQGNPKISDESVHTYEGGYIFKTDRFVGRLTLFYSQMKDLIITTPQGEIVNKGKAVSQGAEGEMAWQIAKWLKLDGNLSYVDTEDKETSQEIPGSTHWLANAGIMIQPVHDWYVSTTYRYVSEFHRQEGDPRSNLKGYRTVNMTLGVENIFTKGLVFRVGVKNLFNADVRYPAAVFPEDYPHTGRESWVQLSYALD